MYFPDKNTINKLILILFSLLLLILSFIAIVNYFQNKNELLKTSDLNDEFLSFISEGNYESSLLLWPEVYTNNKDNQIFLNSFSESLYKVFYNYYNKKYILYDSNTISFFETSRIYYDFIGDENFIKLISLIYEQYFNEAITYETFLAAANDFNQISRFTSVNLSNILNQAFEINQIREIYRNAIIIAEAEIPDYQTAIDELKLIGTTDSIYYPMAIDKIDEYIIKLRDQIKNTYE